MINAVIDLGTNTFHLLIVDLKEDGSQEILHKEKVPVRLGQNGISKGVINDEALERAIKTLRNFKNVMDRHQPEKVTATATSAVRNAKNGRDFVELVLLETGIRVEILSGTEEATLIYEGVKRFVPLGKRTSLIIDIGGGSVEFIIGNETRTFWMRSYEIGGQRLMDMFHKQDPIPGENIQALTNFLDKTLVELYEKIEEYSVDCLVGSSGTFDTLQKMASYLPDHDSGNVQLKIDVFQSLLDQLILKTREERLKIPGMIAMRVDMIVVASILTNHIIEKAKIQDIKTSKYALKEGLLYAGLETSKV